MNDTSRRLKHLVVSATFAIGLGSWACTTAEATCESSSCPEGNACVAGFDTQADEATGDPSKRTMACRLLCSLGPNDQGISSQDKCPPNFHCSMGGESDGSTVPYCVPDKHSYPLPATAGGWGASCNPAAGIDANPSCDSENGFWCYGIGPTDAKAFCTQYGCTEDSDCRGGYWCATVNNGPNARTLTRSYGAESTTTVCLPRAWNPWQGSYCAPCNSDVDCPMNDGVRQHCVSADGAEGSEKICAAECTSDRNCNLDGRCATIAGAAAPVCLPRAGTCRGNGELCAPCRNDADCPDGYCIEAGISSERFCTVKSKQPCSDGVADCPAGLADTLGVACYTARGKLEDQCVNLVQAGVDGANNPAPSIGCWTVARSGR